MARDNKSKYTNKQKRQAQHIEESYEKRGVNKGEAQKRAWATVNKMTGGGRKGGSGRHFTNKAPAIKGGKIGGSASAHRAAATRVTSARKAAKTRKGRKLRATDS